MEVFRLLFSAGGSQESTDLGELKAVRDAVPGGGTIEVLDRVFRVEGDESAVGWNTYNEADDRMKILQQETFYVEPLDVLRDPQPEGLND